MKCPICGKDVELQKKQIGTDENGEPIFNEYAVCRDCRKQWNLDKQRAKKMAAKKAAAGQSEDSAKKAPQRTAEDAAPKKKPSEEAAAKKRAAADGAAPRKRSAGEAASGKRPADGTVRRRPKPADGAPKSTAEDSDTPAKKPVKKRVVRREAPAEGEAQQYGNIPPENVRVKREKAARRGYEDMLATDPEHKPLKKKKAVIDDIDTDENESVKSESARQTAEAKAAPKVPEPEVDDYDDDDYDYEDEARFRPGRIFLGIISLLGFGFFIYRGFVTGLSSTGDNASAGMTYIILALCLLVSALLYLIMQNKSTVFAFLLPMIFYIGTGVFAFLRRGDSMELFIAAIACAVLAVLSLILAILSRGGNDYDDDDYEDAFEDEHDN
ncbi:MAG TPA: hypothetical protein H9757_02630 [Candidatus Mediterraneibacter faecigallinarum]|uniref:Uncharacterized protein n=1 Tax=Candidatus Mediterraneibacter faecigallinarum TaxID=2838669 RepID=A0A9D2SW46_9FIRM|nr:hypothetical protein [Candidatus Mediterraneibacter faecigallinarum]